jgi:hypothetical protein
MQQGQPRPGGNGMPEDLDLDNFLDSYLVQLQSDMSAPQQVVPGMQVRAERRDRHTRPAGWRGPRAVAPAAAAAPRPAGVSLGRTVQRPPGH